MKKMVDGCPTCQMSRWVNPHELVYHTLETVHMPRELAYLDIIGPVTGIRSEYKYLLTVIDSFSRLLATHPLQNRWAKTVVDAIYDIFGKEMSIPSWVIVDRGSEFVAQDTRALIESQLDVKMSFIPDSKHQ